jgi:hypothetical protein
MQSNGTGPMSRQLQDKVGGVMPAGLFLDRDELNFSTF